VVAAVRLENIALEIVEQDPKFRLRWIDPQLAEIPGSEHGPSTSIFIDKERGESRIPTIDCQGTERPCFLRQKSPGSLSSTRGALTRG
jgi:hypothetical protein